MSMSENPSDGMSDDQKIGHKLERIYNRCHSTKYGCKVFTGSTTAQGYWRYHLTYPGAGSVNTTVHEAVYIILERREPDLMWGKEGRRVSHLCGIKLCTNVRYLVLENAPKNRFRFNYQKQSKMWWLSTTVCYSSRQYQSVSSSSYQLTLSPKKNGSFQSQTLQKRIDNNVRFIFYQMKMFIWIHL